MPIPRFTSTGRALLCALAVFILVPAAAKAASGTDLRIATMDGQLADVRQFANASTIQVPTSPNAKCFISGKGGSGRRAPVPGTTALGIAVDAAASVPALDPVLITDEFSFGLGVCGFGGLQPSGSDSFWQVRVDHKALQVGGDQAGAGSDVLWALVPAPVCEQVPPFACQPTVPELVIEAPARALPGETVNIHVNQFSDSGVATASVGANVPGASAPTDARGITTMTVTQNTNVSATKPGTIPSPGREICVNADQSLCPEGHGRTMFGSENEDAIGGTAGPDRVKARAGDDTVRVRGGFIDEVDCGGGEDIARVDRQDKVDRVSCEEILRPRLACQDKKRKSKKQRRKCRRKVRRAAQA